MTDYKRILSYFDSGTAFCSIDTETTGVKVYQANPENPDDKEISSRVIEIGAVLFNKDGVISSFDALINPKKPLSYFVTNLTHITDEMLCSKPSFSEISQDFLDFLGGEETILIAHNAQFDLRFLNAEMENCGKSRLKNHALDTLRLSRIAFPERQSWKLQSLAKDFGIEVLAAHRANDDARVCMEVFKKCTEEIRRKKRVSQIATKSLAMQALE